MWTLGELGYIRRAPLRFSVAETAAVMQHVVADEAQVRVMVKHFGEKWGAEPGSNRHLHDMFPRSGPQKQGNRLPDCCAPRANTEGHGSRP